MKKNLISAVKIIGGIYLTYSIIYGGYVGIKVAKLNKKLMDMASASDNDSINVDGINVIPVLSKNDIDVLGGCCGLTYRPPLSDTVFIILDETMPEEIRHCVMSHEIGHIANGDFNRSNSELNKISRLRYKTPNVSNPATLMEIKADEYALRTDGKEAVLNMFTYLRNRVDEYLSHPMRIRYRNIALADIDFRRNYVEENYC